jgi:hypothetical protein
MALIRLGRTAGAAEAVTTCTRLQPHDPDQWFRQARILALVGETSGRGEYAELALAALRQAVDRGLDDSDGFNYSDLKSLRDRPEFQAMRRQLEHRAAGVSQAP